MAKYYVSKDSQNNGDHEVHTEDCSYLPDEQKRQYLGVYYNCNNAVKKAKEYYPISNGCYYCSKKCHKN